MKSRRVARQRSASTNIAKYLSDILIARKPDLKKSVYCKNFYDLYFTLYEILSRSFMIAY